MTIVPYSRKEKEVLFYHSFEDVMKYELDHCENLFPNGLKDSIITTYIIIDTGETFSIKTMWIENEWVIDKSVEINWRE